MNILLIFLRVRILLESKTIMDLVHRTLAMKRILTLICVGCGFTKLRYPHICFANAYVSNL